MIVPEIILDLKEIKLQDKKDCYLLRSLIKFVLMINLTCGCSERPKSCHMRLFQVVLPFWRFK
jgi:hypothetical protein